MASKSMATSQKKEQQRVLEALLALTGRLIRDEDVEFRGRSIVLPEGTTVEENIEFLSRLLKEREEGTGFSRVFTYKVWDVAHATSEALRKAFGSLRHTGTFLNPPSMMDVPCGPNETVQVPFGQFIVPALPDVEFSVGHQRDEKYGLVGMVSAFGPKKHKGYIESVFDLVSQYLEDHSLYRGKAFTDDDKPEFIDVDAINPDKIVYSEAVNAQLGANVYARLDYPEALAQLDIPFKSAILFEGEFGVGKTEALNLVAKRAVARDITFIKVAPQGDLMQAMQTARMYAPAVVAFEDVDAVGGFEETSRIHEVLEAFDGQQSKLHQVMVLITTNYVETLHKGMVRPGRIDAVINIGPPDAAGIQKLIEVRTPEGKLADNIDWPQVTEAMEGYFPSFVVEATTRAMRYAVVRNEGVLNGAGLATEDLVHAATELRRQFDLHQGAKTGVERPALDTVVRDLIRDAVGAADNPDELIGDVRRVVTRDGEQTRDMLDDKAKRLARFTRDQATEVKEVEQAEGKQTRKTIVERT